MWWLLSDCWVLQPEVPGRRRQSLRMRCADQKNLIAFVRMERFCVALCVALNDHDEEVKRRPGGHLRWPGH